MEIEIWSDVMCPFCYIGKRRLEQALETFSGKKDVRIVWKSFQLNPDIRTDSTKSTTTYLMEEKGLSEEQVHQMLAQVTNMAKDMGLDYQLDRCIVANSLTAHRFLHYAKKYDKQSEAKELVLRAHFIEFQNVDDIEVLMNIGDVLSFDSKELRNVLSSNAYEQEVRYDAYEAHQLGISSVPFFVFNNKFGIPGAQPLQVFIDTLEQASKEY